MTLYLPLRPKAPETPALDCPSDCQHCLSDCQYWAYCLWDFQGGGTIYFLDPPLGENFHCLDQQDDKMNRLPDLYWQRCLSQEHIGSPTGVFGYRRWFALCDIDCPADVVNCLWLLPRDRDCQHPDQMEWQRRFAHQMDCQYPVSNTVSWHCRMVGGGLCPWLSPEQNMGCPGYLEMGEGVGWGGVLLHKVVGVRGSERERASDWETQREGDVSVFFLNMEQSYVFVPSQKEEKGNSRYSKSKLFIFYDTKFYSWFKSLVFLNIKSYLLL